MVAHTFALILTVLGGRSIQALAKVAPRYSEWAEDACLHFPRVARLFHFYLFRTF